MSDLIDNYLLKKPWLVTDSLALTTIADAQVDRMLELLRHLALLLNFFSFFSFFLPLQLNSCSFFFSSLFSHFPMSSFMSNLSP